MATVTRMARFGWLPLLGIVAVSSAGATEGSPLLISWSGSARCRPEADTLEHLRRLLGKDAMENAGRTLTVEARVVENPGSLRLELSEIGGTTPPRLLEVRDCAELAQSLALVISVWLQERAVTAPEPTQALPETQTPTKEPKFGVLTGQLRLYPVAFATQSPASLKLDASVAPTVAFGVMPRVDLGLAAELGLWVRSYHIRTGVFWLSPQSTWATANSSRVGGRFTLLAGSLHFGRRIALARHFVVEPSLWTLLGRMQAEGREANTNAVSRGAWGAAGVSTRVAFERDSFAFGLQMALGVPFGRPHFWVDEILIFQAPSVMGFSQLFVGYRFL